MKGDDPKVARVAEGCTAEGSNNLTKIIERHADRDTLASNAGLQTGCKWLSNQNCQVIYTYIYTSISKYNMFLIIGK